MLELLENQLISLTNGDLMADFDIEELRNRNRGMAAIESSKGISAAASEDPSGGLSS